MRAQSGVIGRGSLVEVLRVLKIEVGGYAGGVALGCLLAFDVGDGGEEALGVVVLWGEEDFVSFTIFYDFSGIHDGDVVGDVADDGEVVRDEDHSEIELVAEVEEEVEDLGLNGDVERGDRFVCDDELWLRGEGSGDGDALTLSAGEFVWVLAHVA